MRSPPPFIFMKILAGPPSAITVLPPCVSRGGRSWLEFCTAFVGLIVRADFQVRVVKPTAPRNCHHFQGQGDWKWWPFLVADGATACPWKWISRSRWISTMSSCFYLRGQCFRPHIKKKNRPRLLIFCVGKKRMVQKLDIVFSKKKVRHSNKFFFAPTIIFMTEHSTQLCYRVYS
jgi:hypothetical protein